MSLSGALSSAISALNAQSQSLSMISDNIANSDTTGYKTTSAMFEQLVTASSSSSSYASGGVTVSGRSNISQQGLLSATSNATDVAIDPEVGKVGPSGSKQVCPKDNTAYTITATNAGGFSTAQVTVAVIGMFRTK